MVFKVADDCRIVMASSGADGATGLGSFLQRLVYEDSVSGPGFDVVADGFDVVVDGFVVVAECFDVVAECLTWSLSALT